MYFSQGNNVVDAEVYDIDSFLWIHEFLPLSSMGLFGTKRAYLHLEKRK
jgi:hypothetical protein